MIFLRIAFHFFANLLQGAGDVAQANSDRMGNTILLKAVETLTMSWSEPKRLNTLQLVFDSDFRYPIRITMAPNRQKQQRPGVPAELVRDYAATLFYQGAPVHTVKVENNRQRCNVLYFPPMLCDRVLFRFRSTNGASDATVFEVRAYGQAN